MSWGLKDYFPLKTWLFSGFVFIWGRVVTILADGNNHTIYLDYNIFSDTPMFVPSYIISD